MTTGGKESRAPRIGVCWVTPGDVKSERYLRAVAVSGGEAVPLPARARSWSVELATIDGLVLTGGGDVDPQLYGEEDRGVCKGVNRQRDILERDTLHRCLDRGLPVLAICRGFQLVNVAMQGALIQDIESELPHRPEGEESSYHEIDLVPGTNLSGILGDQRTVRVNSRHHQGVDAGRVAPGLRVSAVAPDGIVEGLELPGDQSLIAVQCHPEYLADVPHLAVLFQDLLTRVYR